MVAYAVGEMSRQVPTARDSEESIGESQQLSITRTISREQSSTGVEHRRQNPALCYEVVTAWVHPR